VAFLHGSSTALLYNGADISAFCDKADFSGVGAVNETTTFGVAGLAKTYIRGLNDATFTASGFYDGTAGAIDSILSTARTVTTDDILTYCPAGSAAGNRVKAFSIRATDYKVSSPVNNVVSFTGTWQSDGKVTDQSWSLHSLVTETTTGNGTGIDNGIATTAGGDATCHITAVTGAVTIKIQHSSDNITYADLVTVVNASAVIGGYRATVAVGTTINRYTRGQWTPGTTVTFQLSFGRS
jgi:hypothetical protein